jgi:hypothetical protein
VNSTKSKSTSNKTNTIQTSQIDKKSHGRLLAIAIVKIEKTLMVAETHNISIEIALNIGIEIMLNTYIILDFVFNIDYNK